MLLKYIHDMGARRLTPTIADVRRAATELESVEAKEAQRKPRWPDGQASQDWWYGFKARHGLRLRSCQVDEADRIAACTPEVVQGFFDVYKPLYEKFCNVAGRVRIFNMDESPIMQLGRWAKGVVLAGNTGQIHRVGGSSRALMRQLVSMVTCFSPDALIPHVFIGKGAGRKRDPLQHCAETMPGAAFICSKTAMINHEIFAMWLDHFVKHVPGGVSPENPVLLLADGHSSRLNPDNIAKAKQLGVEILLFPGKCTHELQPCDQIFGGFKTNVSREVRTHARRRR
ncbi:hypothetical protein PLESTF_001353100 [Pleodorina starrii]|nr:hypothetical protein PLESTF_001348800 [Pleodorina starrii]GLC73260.1 hypothetical protein PLESTF_001353100 [Pleodorina starrii]